MRYRIAASVWPLAETVLSIFAVSQLVMRFALLRRSLYTFRFIISSAAPEAPIKVSISSICSLALKYSTFRPLRRICFGAKPRPIKSASRSWMRWYRGEINSKLYSLCGLVMVPLQRNAAAAKALTPRSEERFRSLRRRFGSSPVWPNSVSIRRTSSGSRTENSHTPFSVSLLGRIFPITPARANTFWAYRATAGSSV